MPKIQVDGMHCEHCKNAVEKAVSAIPGVKYARRRAVTACFFAAVKRAQGIPFTFECASIHNCSWPASAGFFVADSKLNWYLH